MLSDPIAALATPAGRSAIAVVRLSGEGAFAIAARVIEGFVEGPHRRMRLARFLDSGGVPVDEGLYLTFPAPHSYTGEDLVELSGHGGLLAPARVLAALQAAGARPALPGEFTRRAVLNRKLDLLQAEAVGDLIDASVPAQARTALHQLEGGLSRRIATLRERLLELSALLNYEVDFPEEDELPVSRETLRARLGELERDAAGLLATAPTGERLREGALVVLAGRPNVGKSSLFNALLGADRALVTEVPGTTRDTIEAQTDVLGWPVRLADTAGLWEAPEAIDRLGVEVSRRYLAAADLVLLCAEAGRGLEAEERVMLDSRPALAVRTKADLAGGAGDREALTVSALTGFGLERLRATIVKRLYPDGAAADYTSLEPMLTRERHRVALARAAAELEGARAQLSPGGEAVLAAQHVRLAGLALEEMVGVVDADQVLDRIFSRFCVGK